MWLQFDWGSGPVVGGRAPLLFCAWLAWSRFRVVLATWDRTLPTLLGCIDATLPRLDGAPTYLLGDNERTVTVDRVAGLAVRHPEMVAAGRHYGMVVQTCVPYDPETKGGVEATVRIAKADLVPTTANLREQYPSFAGVAAACAAFCERVNARPHAETRRPRRRCWPRNGRACTSCPASPTRRRWARPDSCATTRPSAGARCATRRPKATWAARCGAGWRERSW